jgi:hypothetical protein
VDRSGNVFVDPSHIEDAIHDHARDWALHLRFGGTIAESGWNETRVFVVSNNRGWGMKTLKVSLIASSIGTAVGLVSWVFGLGQIIWSAHPQMASFLLTLVTTIVIQITWPRLTETNSR